MSPLKLDRLSNEIVYVLGFTHEIKRHRKDCPYVARSHYVKEEIPEGWTKHPNHYFSNCSFCKPQLSLKEV